jgi:23S rRNA (guanosine2251-2'-O)-methyltransferase
MDPRSHSVLILPDIRSALNVGSLFRTAEAVGIAKIYLAGVTPCPTDQFLRVQKDIAKSALGAEALVPWEHKKSIRALIARLKKDGYEIVALEQDSRAIDYRLFAQTKHTAYIVGTEVTGIPKPVLALCDTILEIPLYGKKESLNVSVACGVALFRTMRS